jgi:hypothetical protein
MTTTDDSVAYQHDYYVPGENKSKDGRSRQGSTVRFTGVEVDLPGYVLPEVNWEKDPPNKYILYNIYIYILWYRAKPLVAKGCMLSYGASSYFNGDWERYY